MFPFTRRRKTKTNILATECAFYSAESIPRRLNLWFTQVSLSVFTRGHCGEAWRGLWPWLHPGRNFRSYSSRSQRVREQMVGQDHRERAPGLGDIWGGEKGQLLVFLLCTCCFDVQNTLLFFSLADSYSLLKAQLQPSLTTLGRVGTSSLELPESCTHPPGGRPPGRPLSRQQASGGSDHSIAARKAQPRARHTVNNE